jgi:hypothetical protein
MLEAKSVEPGDFVPTLIAAHEWAASEGDPLTAVTTREVIIWATVQDPLAWNRIADTLGSGSPENIERDELEPLAPSSLSLALAGSGVPISTHVVEAVELAARLSDSYNLDVGIRVLAFAALLVPDSSAQRWGTRSTDLFEVAAVASVELFGTTLAGLSDCADLSRPSAGQSPIPAKSDGAVQLAAPHLSTQIILAVLAFVVLRLVLHATVVTSLCTALLCLLRISPHSSFQRRSRLALTEVASIALLATAIVFAVRAIPQTLRATAHAHAISEAEDLINSGDASQSLEVLEELRRDRAEPAVLKPLACASDALGFREYAVLQLQVALLLGADKLEAPAIPECFANRAQELGNLRVVVSAANWHLITPAKPGPWTAQLTSYFERRQDNAGLITLACAHHEVGNRLLAALFMTLTLNRIEGALAGVAPENLSDELPAQFSGSAAACAHALTRDADYEVAMLGGSFHVRPVDFADRVP